MGRVTRTGGCPIAASGGAGKGSVRRNQRSACNMFSQGAAGARGHKASRSSCTAGHKQTRWAKESGEAVTKGAREGRFSWEGASRVVSPREEQFQYTALSPHVCVGVFSVQFVQGPNNEAMRRYILLNPMLEAESGPMCVDLLKMVSFPQ